MITLSPGPMPALTREDYERDRTSLGQALSHRLMYSIGKDPITATTRDWFEATAYAVRERLIERWMETMRSYYHSDAKRVYYLSLEFLTGRVLSNSLLNLGLYGPCRDALSDLELCFDHISDTEPDAALGNGGLGRLAACFLDSMATLSLPAYGYGIRYEYGMFRQHIRSSSADASSSSPTNTASHGSTGSTRNTSWRWRSTRPSPATEPRRSTTCASGRRKPRATSI